MIFDWLDFAVVFVLTIHTVPSLRLRNEANRNHSVGAANLVKQVLLTGHNDKNGGGGGGLSHTSG